MYTVELNFQQPQLWDEFVNNHPYGNVLQQSAWAISKLPNWQSQIVVICDGKEIVAGAQILFRTLPFPFKGHKLSYIARGPVVDYNDHELVKMILEAVETVAKKKRALSVICDPAILRSEFEAEMLPFMADLGYTHAGFTQKMAEIQPRYNMILDLHKADGNWRKLISSNCRTRINKASRQPLNIVRKNPGELRDFFAILSETGVRDSISVRDRDYYEHIIHAFRKSNAEHFSVSYLDRDPAIEFYTREAENLLREIADNRQQLATASPEKQKSLNNNIATRQKALDNIQSDLTKLQSMSLQRIPLACAALIFGSNCCHYIYGGSSNLFRSSMPVYGLLANLIDLAQEKGYDYFDFGGVSGNTNPETDPHYGGLYIFKKHWGADLIEYVGEFNKSLSFLNGIFSLAVRLRKLWRQR